MRNAWRDESGKWSSARLSFWLVLIVSLALVGAESLGFITDLTSGAYVFLGTAITITGAWAGAPRTVKNFQYRNRYRKDDIAGLNPTED